MRFGECCLHQCAALFRREALGHLFHYFERADDTGKGVVEIMHDGVKHLEQQCVAFCADNFHNNILR